MSEIFFTADHHFGHANILEYCGRPFSSVEEMDEEMIRLWNETVGDDDVVYHLGDFTLGDLYAFSKYLRKPNGYIYVLSNPWHHDKRWLSDVMAREGSKLSFLDPDVGKSGSGHFVNVLPPVCVLELSDCPPVVLCHYPFEVWDRKHYDAWHLHGHSHGKLPPRGLRLDVGVDAWEFRPVGLDGVAKKMALLVKTKND